MPDEENWRSQHESNLAAIRQELRRARRECIREAREDRKRQQQRDARFNEIMTQLAAAQRVTAEMHQALDAKIDRFLEGLGRGKGHPPAA